jgi:YidC/Oxa1 family membrane protein insertase
VDTEMLVARIAPVGGRITSLRLKKYRTAVSSESEPLEMIQVAPGAAAPLGVRLASEDGRVVEDDTQVAYTSDRREVSLRGSETATLVLRGTFPSGATIEKRLTFTAGSYPIDLEVRTSGFPDQLSRIGVGWRHQIGEAIQGDPELRYRGTLVLEDKKVVRDLATSLAASPPKVFAAPVGWVGYADHYFAAALIPAEPGQARAVVTPEAGGVQLLLTSPRASTAEGSARFTVYVGPKDVEVLAGAGHQLERAVDFGWFSFLAIPCSGC